MKLKIMLIAVVLSLGIFAFSGPVFASEKGSHKGAATDGDITARATEGGAIKVGNTICPLSKEKVGEMGDVVEYEHEGKIYNFCCKMCLKDFKKDPDKYIQIINESMAGEAAEEAEDGHTDYDH